MNLPKTNFLFRKYTFITLLLLICLSSISAEPLNNSEYRDIIIKNSWIGKKSGKLTAEKKTALAWLDAHEHIGADIATYIWHHPELGLGEHKSSAILQDFLKRAGFTVEAGVGDQKTGFVASWGQGKPVIGFNAEFDALPGLSQVKGLAVKKPVIENGPGHGCGHNMLGTYSVMAGIAVKEMLAKYGINGTVKVYGTPAEENFGGKTFFVKHGVYNDADVVIAWHPGGDSGIAYYTTLASGKYKVQFYGTSSHAAASPWAGRSALDAVELMSVGVNYMREHISPKVRVMSFITNGGQALNVVPPFAEVWYGIRAPDYKIVQETMLWIRDIAEAAAKMTQTRVEFTPINGVWQYLPNNVLSRVGEANVQLIGPPKWTKGDQEAGKPISLTTGVKEGPYYSTTINEFDLNEAREWGEAPFSIDEANVSWIVPMVRFDSATQPRGVGGHTWQQVAWNCMPQAFKGGLVAAKYMAATAVDLFMNPKYIDAAKREHKRNIEKHGPFEDPTKNLNVPDFETFHGIKEEDVPKPWEQEPFAYPESLKTFGERN